MEERITRVEIGPGWTMFRFDTQPVAEIRRVHCLIDFVYKWCQEWPDRRIEDIQIVRDGGVVRAMNVFWTVFDPAIAMAAQAESNFHFNVYAGIRDKYGDEYVEAIIQDALQWLANATIAGPAVALLSRRRIAIVAYRDQGRGFVTEMPMLFEHIPDEPRRAIELDFEAWLRTDQPGYFVLPLPPGLRLNLGDDPA